MSDLARFVQQVEALRTRATSAEAVVEQVKGALVSLLDPAALPQALFHDPIREPLRLLLHRSDVVTVFAIASPPGFVSKIHDHGSWGVVGQVSGVETEDVYRLRHVEPTATGDQATMIGLRRVSSAQLHAGDIVTIVPPDRDIHEVRTSLAGPSVSLHAFVRDPVGNGFDYFEPRLYATHRYQGQYDNEPGIVAEP